MKSKIKYERLQQQQQKGPLFIIDKNLNIHIARLLPL